MAFFNYSTMQMTAKVVYYGPGLGGKTSNLQHIYGHTASNSRGEMVSLETQTDRTLFFDLLPVDVGTVAGFRTKLQLYTVPGQVFYNSTRKLVLKGVDAVVFVADSQTPMLQANLDSLNNLGENLEELGLTLDTVPVVIQYNKRDLPDVLPIAELEAALNTRGWPSYEASALTGQGVFETLRGVVRLTLLSLRDQLEASSYKGITQEPPSAEDNGRQEVSEEPARRSIVTSREPQAIRREYRLRLPADEFEKTRSIVVGLRIEDESGAVVRETRSVRLNVDDPESIEAVLLKLGISLRREE